MIRIRTASLVSISASSLLSLSFAFSVVGCGGSSGGGTASVSQMVSQATGGEVSVGSSGARLSIPASSLAADTTITAASSTPAASLPDHDTLKGLYYDFGPDGTTFDPPATLTLPAAGTPPAGSAAVISWFDGSQWNDLATTLSGGMVSAPVAHFTGFVVRWVVTGSGGSVDCSSPKTACGGDIVGTWTPTGACLAPDDVTGCTDSSVTYSVSLMGSAQFNADMTYAVSLPYSVTGIFHASPDCLSGAQITSCADGQTQLRTVEDSHFPTLWANATCTGDVQTSGCVCMGSTTGSITTNETGTYTVSGNAFTTTKTGGDVGDPNPYCVDGNTIWVQTQSDPPEYLVLTR